MTSGRIDRGAVFVGVTVAGLVLLVAARLACVDGILRRVSIDGPSMAPAFLGRHYAAGCVDCGFPLFFDADHVPDDERYVCPNCGFIHEELPRDSIRPAQAVLIDRWPLVWRQPRRGEVVACRAPDGAATVKRVAWLPGERPAIVEGDLYDGERLLRAPLDEARRRRLLVHDDAHRPTKTTAAPPRWRGDGWQGDRERYRLEMDAAQKDDRWLVYDQWPATLDATRRTTSFPVTDNDSYNQGQTVRELHIAHDVGLTCNVLASGPFRLVAWDGKRRMEVEVQPQRRAVLRINGNEADRRPLARAHFRGPCLVEFGLCDEQVYLALDGQTIFCRAYQRDKNSRAEAPHPLAIGAASEGFEVSQVCVWRDIYYLDAAGLSRGWQSGRQLGGREYGLLGDNQPVSTDSRQWERVGLARAAIWGLVYRPFWNAWGGTP